jgi:parallel beta-helix repeat protein
MHLRRQFGRGWVSPLVVSFVLLSSNSALAATTHWVNDPPSMYSLPPGASCAMPGYPTIGLAVAAAAPGDIIEVCEGIYNESVTIAIPLTLRGPNAGTSALAARGPEAFVNSPVTTFNVTGGQDVTIDGFTITGDFGIYVSLSTTDTVIQNNRVTGVTRALTLDGPGSNASVLDNDLISNIRSLHVSGGPYANMTVNGNRFSGAATTGIFFSGALSNSISGFEFRNNTVLHLANIASNISNGTVSGNTFDVAAPGILNLQINLHNSIVSSNTFDGNSTTACFQLFGSQFGLVPSDHVTVSGNTFSNCNVYGIQLSQDIHHIFIANNTISNNVDGVNTRDIPPPWDVTGKEIHINFNNITGNTNFGVRNGQMGVLDAECNWWGAADGPGPVGPGSGDRVSTGVDFTPWLAAPAPGGACFGGSPSGGTVTGGGQIDANPGTGSFGFSANAARQRGHLNYTNHSTREHLNCTVDMVVILSANKAQLSGTCSSNSDADTFTAEVEDNAEPGKGADEFTITYNTKTEGGTLIRGNIQIH